MLEIRPNCENCNKPLPNESEHAMICSFECTYCTECVTHILKNVCPNCGGGLEKRPSRPLASLQKYPASDEAVFKPVDEEKFAGLLLKYAGVKPTDR